MTEAAPIKVDEREGGVWLVTLDRPEVRNVIDQAMVSGLHGVLDRLERDRSVRALVLTGAGEKAFAAGADLRQLIERRRDDALARINSAVFERLESARCPTIAAVRGFCLGGGAELALACDMRVAGRSARFGQPEVSLGIIPAAGATYRLPRLVGHGKARELIFTGRIIDAAEAEALGLVERVVDDERVVDEALALAASIAANASTAVELAKVMLLQAARGARPSEVESIAQAVLFETEEKRERMQGFLDERARRKAARGDG